MLCHQLRVCAYFDGFHAKLGSDFEAAEQCGVFGDIVCAVRETFSKLYGWDKLIVGVNRDSDAGASRVAFTCAIRVNQCVLCHRCIVWCVSGIRGVQSPFLADDSCRMPLMESKVILITGAGSGVGRATALKFLRLGWRVVLAGRRIDALKETVALSGCSGELAMVFSVDVTDPNQMTALFDAAVDRFGRIDVVFNNAGIVRGGAPDVLSVDDWNAVISANVTGTFLGIREAFRVFKAQSPMGGRIINNGSLAAHTPRPDAIAYTASKHAVTGMTKAASLDGRAFNIAVGQIDIGNAESDMTVNMHKGVPQPDGSIMVEPLLTGETVADAVVYMAGLPLEANVLFMSVMATKMPFVGRG